MKFKTTKQIENEGDFIKWIRIFSVAPILGFIINLIIYFIRWNFTGFWFSFRFGLVAFIILFITLIDYVHNDQKRK